jgi:CheY-like chemotaxis protein
MVSSPANRAAAQPLRVLHVEDSVPDHELALLHLLRAGLRIDCSRVDTEDGLRHALATQRWDVVLSDFNLPGFNGLRAQEILRESGQDLPFILVSGEIGEDTAVAAMRNGADDYLLKNNLSRLAPAVEHAIAAHDAPRPAPAPTASWPPAASACRTGPAPADQRRDGACGDRPRDPRRRGRQPHGHQVRPGLDRRHGGRRRAAAECSSACTPLETVQHAIEASQRIMHNLRPAILEQGLVAALQWMAAASRSAPASPACSAPATRARSCPRVCRWWPTALRRRR